MEDKILEAFDFGPIQSCKQIEEKLDENNVSWEEFLEWVEEKEKSLQGRRSQEGSALDFGHNL